MRFTALLLALCCSIGLVGAQPRYLPIPGYNVGLPAHGAYYQAWYRGQPALILAIPGSSTIATVFDPAYLPPGTQRVQLRIREFWVFDPRACAVGSQFFFQETIPTAMVPWGAIGTPGANWYPRPFELGLSPGDPGYSNWRLNYCNPGGCHSRCGPFDVEPLLEAYLITIAML